MRTNIQIVCSKKPGTLLKTIAGFRQQNIMVVKQRSDQLPVYDLVLEGADEDCEAVIRIAQETEGVLDVHLLDESTNEFKVIPNVPKKELDNGEDLWVAYDLAHQFPIIEDRLLEYCSKITNGSQPKAAEGLGWQVASLRKNRLQSLNSSATSRELFENCLFPELNEIADIEPIKQGLLVGNLNFNGNVTSNPGNEKPQSGLARNIKYQFIIGYIQGLIAASDYFADFSVHVQPYHSGKPMRIQFDTQP